jgi:hypothetical protein
MLDKLSFKLNPNITLSDIPDANVAEIHDFFYSRFKFNKLKYDANIL